MMPSVLIIGGAGYKGTVIAELLCDHGYPVTIFDCFRWGEEPVLHLFRRGVRVVRGDVTSRDDVAAVARDHDVVIHLAALVGFPACAKHPVLAKEINVGGTRNVTEALSTQQQLIFASSGSVYGKLDGICTEDTPANPLTLYGKTKLEGEKMVLGRGGTALRFASLFGVSACMRFDLLVNSFVYRAVHIGWMALFCPYDRRTFLHVNDTAVSYVRAVQNYESMQGQVFNVGDESMNCTKQHVVDTVTEHVPMKVIVEDQGRDPDGRDYAVKYDRFRERVGFAAQIDLAAGVQEVAAAAKFSCMKADWRFTP